MSLKLIAGLALFFVAGSALLEEGGNPAMWLLLGLGVKLMADARRRGRSQPAGAALRPARNDQARPTPDHADHAVRRAGHDPARMALRVSDIGVFAICHGRETLVHRVQALRDDVDYIQPWVALHVPTAATGTLRFEIRDMEGRLHFARERTLQLEAGDNLVSPAARMPVHDALLTEGDWQLRVHADGNLLAAHNFCWYEADGRAVETRPRARLDEDGEMSVELRQAFEEIGREQEQSLDELLAFQQERARA